MTNTARYVAQRGRIPDVRSRGLFSTVAFNREIWLNRIVAYRNGDYFNQTGVDEMSALKNAHGILAILQLGEAVTEAVEAKHEKGEHFTLGDLAGVVAERAVPTIEEAGLSGEVWKPAPKKRGGRRAAGDTGNGDTS